MLLAVTGFVVRDSRFAETWFPGPGVPLKEKVDINPTDIAKALEANKRAFSPSYGPLPDYAHAIYPVWAFCVAYRSSFTDVQYHTAYLFQIYREGSNETLIIPMQKGDIPPSELRLYLHPFYGVSAE